MSKTKHVIRFTFFSSILCLFALLSACDDDETPEPEAITANFSTSMQSIQQGETVTFTDETVGNPVSWNWVFEGGTPATSSSQNPTVTYHTPGTFEVTLIAANNDNTDHITKINHITVADTSQTVVASFSSNTTRINKGESITFTDESTGNPTSWSWVFEGGNPATSTDQNPTVTYETAGTYEVTLIVSNNNSSDNLTQIDYITVTGIDLSEGLIAHYPFNGNANDESGNGHNGIVNGPSLTIDRFGNANCAYNFDGMDDFIQIADHTDLRLSGTDYTISTWVKIDESNNSISNTILSKRSECDQNGWLFHLIDDPNDSRPLNTVLYETSGCTDPKVISGGTIGYGNWYNLVLVYNQNNRTGAIFINGFEIGNNLDFPSPNANESSDLFIGNDNFSLVFTTDYFFKGQIDDIRIYNKALNQDEINALKNEGK